MRQPGRLKVQAPDARGRVLVTESNESSGGQSAVGRAMVSLEGLSCGDGFGESFSGLSRSWKRIEARELPEAPWPVTDDTMMAISVIETLRAHGEIREEWLATHFARMYDPTRGYGAAMHGLLGRIGVLGGAVWREEAGALFGGRGSFGNGSSMRVAPLGAFFADDLDRLVVEAERSAATTHAHGEAAAGAIAVALGAAIAWRGRSEEASGVREFLAEVQMRVPPSEVRDGIGRAMELPEDTPARLAGAKLGNGSRVTVMDTVPFALWSAGSSLGSFEEAMWRTVSAGGDMDTTCATVGGMVAMRVGLEGIPMEWRRRREPLFAFFKRP